MTVPEVGDALLISPSVRGHLTNLGILAAILCGYVVFGVFGVIGRGLMWSGVAVFGAILAFGIYPMARALHPSWELRLDRKGLTVRGHSTKPWSDFAEVRVSGMRPRWIFWCSLGFRVVSFIGKPGVELPILPSAKIGGRAVGSTRLRHRWYGTDLLLMPYAFDASTEAIVSAVRRFSDVPVMRR
jgi:hypothetical protein